MDTDPSDPLPPLCYALLACNPAGERIVAIRRNERGHFSTSLDAPSQSLEQARATVDLLNRKLGVSEEQKQAMIGGSMFGWNPRRSATAPKPN
ncbi:MAG TPA: hypothetical protein PKV98_13260 [Burkholderiaceae bacterium]|nr:hypothetical protein [Burkholderiaceae bacterium]